MTYSIVTYVQANVIIIRTDSADLQTIEALSQALIDLAAQVDVDKLYILLDFHKADFDFSHLMTIMKKLKQIEWTFCDHQIFMILLGQHKLMSTVQTMLMKNELVAEGRLLKIDNLGNALDWVRRQIRS